MKKLMIIVLAMLWGGVAVAQHSHGNQKGPNGGLMQDVAGVHAELLVSGNNITINVLDESNKPASAPPSPKTATTPTSMAAAEPIMRKPVMVASSTRPSSMRCNS